MASPPPPARFFSDKSKKRAFPGSSSSSSYMDPEVVEIPQPGHWTRTPKFNPLKQKEVVQPEVIDIEMDEDSDGVVVDEKIDTRNKGKEPLAVFPCTSESSAKPRSVGGVQIPKKRSALRPHSSFNIDHDFSDGYDEYMEIYHDDLTYDDEYAFVQAHFDSLDIPPGVEASIPWFSDPAGRKKNPATANHMGSLTHPHKVDLSSSTSFSESAQNDKSAASTSSIYSSSQTEGTLTNLPSRLKSGYMPKFSYGKMKPVFSGYQPDTKKASSGMDPSFNGYYHGNKLKKSVGSGSLTYSWSSAMDTMNFPPDAYMFESLGSTAFANETSFLDEDFFNPFDAVPSNAHWIHNHAKSQESAAAVLSTTVPSGPTYSIDKHVNENDIMERFRLFKQFDTVQDHSDHHYSNKGSLVMQPSKNWAKKIQEEWRILEKDLPDTIFVRVYESRMDLLRAVIVGAEGTPYHDGLFFFDVFFPHDYPSVPPHVHYHSGGLGINPNLYCSGKVCLSLLNTWNGSRNEMWIPGVSTMLQVLVSIQALILNEKPYFNEPGYESMSGSASGESMSQDYNKHVFIQTLQTMVYNIRRPPKHFEDYVFGHFCKRAQGILAVCKVHMDSAQVGYCPPRAGFMVGGVGYHNLQYGNNSLPGFFPLLVQTFSQIGAKDCEKFLSPAEKENSGVSPVPMAANHY